MSPDIAPGEEGMELIFTAREFVEDDPQKLFALTVIFPPAVPAEAEIEVVVEEPDQPEGNVHV